LTPYLITIENDFVLLNLELMVKKKKHLTRYRFAGVIFLLAILSVFPQLTTHSKSPTLGVIRGVVEDKSGKPISGAVITVFKEGTQKVLKQMIADADGFFSSRFLPGKYSLIAVASGFNASTSNPVQVVRSSEVVYRFNLEPIGSGRTVPEKRRDRSESKWAIRAAQIRRSVFQFDEPSDSELASTDSASEDYAFTELRGLTGVITQRKASLLELHGGSANFATLYGVSATSDLLFTGQFSRGPVRHNRFDVTLSANPSTRHSLRISTGLNQISGIGISDAAQNQLHFRATDQVVLSDGLFLLFGFDYSRLLGETRDSHLAPRFGVQYDANSQTRIKGNFFSIDSDEVEGARIVTAEGISTIFIDTPASYRRASSRPKREVSNPGRFEFGVERLIDNRSFIEGTVFIDIVGQNELSLLGINTNGETIGDFTETLTEGTSGVNVIYSRSLDSKLSFSSGYSFGISPRLRINPTTDVLDVAEKSSYHTFFAQLSTDIGRSTRIRTIVRFSPQATVYSIDPFLGKVMVHDPGVSFIVTRLLPNLGLPIRAEASLDARNIFDFPTEAGSEEGTIRLANHRRMLRGGIMVRF